MKIEHVAYSVSEPAKVAAWYEKNLGFKIVRSMDTAPVMHFLADDSGKMLIEIYNNPAVKVPDYRAMDPLLLHLALVSTDPIKDKERLLAAGATVAADYLKTPMGDELIMLRDPWGFAVQLCRRTKPMM